MWRLTTYILITLKHMKNILLLATLVFVISCSSNNNNSISLNVNHTIQIPIEFVTASVSINEPGSSASEVEVQGYEKLSQVVNLLTESGVSYNDIEINPGIVNNLYYREDPFEFRSSLTFDIHDLDKIDTFRRAIIGAGGTTFRIQSYSNHLEDSLYNAAYQNSIQEARKRAEKLLYHQPNTVGNILNLHENVSETIEIHRTGQRSEDDVEYEMIEMVHVPSMFNKEFYTKEIKFSVEFELLPK